MIIASYNPKPNFSTLLFAAGIILFSLPLYYRAFTEKKIFEGRLLPAGGFGMIFGWITLAFRR